MARLGKKTLNIGPAKLGSRVWRIGIPQPLKRPIRVGQKRFYNVYSLRNDPWWWVTHKRGIRRTKVGVDPREARAVPKSLIKGTLPERIVFKWLVVHNFVSGIDFTFQSSLEGGRLEYGGIVVDFEFPQLKLILQIQGPTHNQLLRKQKDNEQRMILSSYGYEVLELDDDVIYNEAQFDQEMAKIFNLNSYRGGASCDFSIFGLEDDAQSQYLLDSISSQLSLIETSVRQLEMSL